MIVLDSIFVVSIGGSVVLTIPDQHLPEILIVLDAVTAGYLAWLLVHSRFALPTVPLLCNWG